VTPEATLAVLEREAPGLAELMRRDGLRRTPMAALSRAVAGSRGATLIVNLPGSPKGVRESLEACCPCCRTPSSCSAAERGRTRRVTVTEASRIDPRPR
jgi:molybdopterin biosynthesis enzyme MoaB